MISDRTKNLLDDMFIIAQDLPLVYKARIVASLVHKGKVIAIGTNQYKTHPMAAKFAHHPSATSLHAEVACIRNAINRHGTEILKKSTLHVVRAKTTPSREEFVHGLAKPCSGCERAIRTFEIPEVIYSTDEQNNFGIILLDY